MFNHTCHSRLASPLYRLKVWRVCLSFVHLWVLGTAPSPCAVQWAIIDWPGTSLLSFCRGLWSLLAGNSFSDSRIQITPWSMAGNQYVLRIDWCLLLISLISVKGKQRQVIYKNKWFYFCESQKSAVWIYHLQWIPGSDICMLNGEVTGNAQLLLQGEGSIISGTGSASSLFRSPVHACI